MKLRFMRRRGTANEGTAGTAGIDGNMMNGGAGWSLRAALGEKGICFPLFFFSLYLLLLLVTLFLP